VTFGAAMNWPQWTFGRIALIGSAAAVHSVSDMGWTGSWGAVLWNAMHWPAIPFVVNWVIKLHWIEWVEPLPCFRAGLVFREVGARGLSLEGLQCSLKRVPASDNLLFQRLICDRISAVLRAEVVALLNHPIQLG